MVADFSKPMTAVGMKFRNPADEDEFVVQVHDKFPQMGDVHVEGRRYVEVSIEMFITMAALRGYEPVDPNEGVEQDG